MDFDIETNLSKLPLAVATQLGQCLEQNNIWQHLFNSESEDSAYIIR
jgi:hypothetical protein